MLARALFVGVTFRHIREHRRAITEMDFNEPRLLI